MSSGHVRIYGLTLWPPWSGVVAAGVKRVENRSWEPPIPVGTLLAIHAGKTYDDAGAQWIRQHLGLSLPQDSVKSALVAVARYEGLVPPDCKDPWYFGEVGLSGKPNVGWHLGNTRALPTPVPCRGYQKLWGLPRDVWEQVARQLPELA